MNNWNRYLNNNRHQYIKKNDRIRIVSRSLILQNWAFFFEKALTRQKFSSKLFAGTWTVENLWWYICRIILHVLIRVFRKSVRLSVYWLVCRGIGIKYFPIYIIFILFTTFNICIRNATRFSISNCSISNKRARALNIKQLFEVRTAWATFLYFFHYATSEQDGAPKK